MKSRFTTIDIRAVIAEIEEQLQGMRVVNVYDVDHKTYLIKLQKPEAKAVLLLESGIRIHTTAFEWPKHMTPSGFSMKLRKHLRSRRLESVTQLGVDRIIDLQFGSGEAAYHVILELYDRGNIVLTDYEYIILNILRPRTDESQDVRFAVREKYPIDAAKQHQPPFSVESLRDLLLEAGEGDPLKKVLNPKLAYGPAVIDHALLCVGLTSGAKIGKGFDISQDVPRLVQALEIAEDILQKAGNKETRKGYIIQKSEPRAAAAEGEPAVLLTYQEFHPFLYKQHEKSPSVETDSFDKAVDEFFSKIECQKLDIQVVAQEKSALKKLENVKRDHEKRLDELQKNQDTDKVKAELIEMNLPLVDRAIVIVNSAIANQIDWAEISGIVKEAQSQGDPVASAIVKLKLDVNIITMALREPDADSSDTKAVTKPKHIDIDLGLSAYSNATKHFDKKRFAARKEQKTIDASTKALKNAEKKTKEKLKEVAAVATINKARKVFWFEKFLWFISSENYLVIGGRDQQQNEMIFKKYLKPGDIYVHADLHGASTVVIKNPSGGEVPPKALNEAGTMAVCNSAAWDARVVTSAWWVYHHQVSKTAPTGEYLTTGSFMIRGKKNFLPPCYLVYGFGFLFKIDDSCVFRHQDERKVRQIDDDNISIATESEISIVTDDVSEGEIDESSDDDTNDSESVSSKSSSNDTRTPKAMDIDVSQLETKPELLDKCLNENDTDTSAGSKENEPAAKTASSDEENAFPDTNIKLQYVGGDKYELQRLTDATGTDQDHIYLGDDVPVPLGTSQNTATHTTRMTAKQKRDIKKQKKKQLPENNEEEVVDDVISTSQKQDDNMMEKKSQSKTDAQEKPQQQQQPKRGQKAKLKKIKEKYKDQDEEERMLKMEILASAGTKKEEIPKKGKKGKQWKQEQRQKQQQKQSSSKQPQERHGPKQLSDITVKVEEMAVVEDQGSKEDPITKDAGEEEEDGDDPEQQVNQVQEDASALDTLTGIPHTEDEMHFAVPVCAPYSVMVNYKYKVKLTPGTQKRGKAAKTALNMFTFDRATSQREKDLFKSVKDTDLSRNIPGKVKVSAPNLQKSKRK